ncbi:MAG: mechanosensitive ion channel family protein, partial [Bacteroidota bacterium]
IGNELKEHPEWGEMLLENIEIFGVDELGENGVVIKVRLKTVAGQQWAVKREFNKIIKLRFDQEGIDIPFPQRTISFF